MLTFAVIAVALFFGIYVVSLLERLSDSVGRVSERLKDVEQSVIWQVLE